MLKVHHSKAEHPLALRFQMAYLVLFAAAWRVAAGLLLIGLCFTAVPAKAQSKNAGEIRGTVTDRSGAAVAGVHVLATETATGITTSTVSGDSGVYDLPYVASGNYSIRFVKDGYEAYAANEIQLHIETITVNAILEVGAATSTVNVTAEPTILQTETSEQSTVLGLEQVSQLPIVSNNWQTLTELLPGVSPGGKGQTAQGGANVSINGGQQYQSSWFLDGGTATFPISNNPDLLSPPLETIAEVNINTSGFGAEYGNGLSTMNVTTKSGTNSFHGSLFEYNQNDIYNAAPKNWSAEPQSKPKVRWNEYGGTVGGPIVRDRLFFFFGYQRNPVGSSTTGLYSFPTADIRAGDFSNAAFPQIYDPATTSGESANTSRQAFANNQIPSSRLDPVALAVQKYFPMPNAINPNNPYYNNYYFSAPNPQLQTWFNWKIDGNATPKHHVYSSGERSDLSQNDPSPDCPIDCYSSNIREISAQITDAWAIAPTKLNEFRIAVANTFSDWHPQAAGQGYPAKIGLPTLPADTFPSINVATGPGYSIGGNSLQAIIGETNATVSDSFTWIYGKHTMKLGGEFDYWTDNLGWQTLQAGSFNFNGIGTRDPDSNDPGTSPGVGYADFLLGYTQSWSVSIPIETGGRTHNVQLFAQDYLKLKRNLTINYGLRYLRQNGWTDEHNRIALYSPTLTNPATGLPGALGYAGVQLPTAVEAPANFVSPRVGFAWQPFPKTSIRGGFGFYPMPWSSNGYITGVGTGWTIQGSEQSTDNLTDVFPLASGPPDPVVPTAASRTPTLLNGQSVPYNPYHTPVSYLEEFQLSVQRQFGNYLLEAAYVGNVTRKLPWNSDINQAVNLELGTRPNPTYQSISAQNYSGTANYNSLQLTTKRQFHDGFSFLANYTWAKCMDTGTGSGGNGFGVDSYQNAYSAAANYGACAGDIRQLLNGSVIYQLPIGRGRQFLNHNTLLDLVVGGWQTSTVFNARTGLPFTPLMSYNLSFSQAGMWYPNRVASGKLSKPSVNEWFDTSAFTQPAPHTFGDSGRNFLYGPRYINFDLSLAKTFGFSVLENPASFQLKLDATDIFNHPNYGLPNSQIGTLSAGVISSSLTNRSMQVGGVFRF